MYRKQTTENTTQYPRAVIRGFIAVPLLMLFLLGVAFAESKGWLQQGREGLAIFICMFVAAFIAGRCGARGIRTQKLCHSLCAELGLVLFNLLLGLFTKESPFFNMLLLWSAITVLFGAFLSAALVPRITRSARKKKAYNK